MKNMKNFIDYMKSQFNSGNDDNGPAAFDRWLENIMQDKQQLAEYVRFAIEDQEVDPYIILNI